MRRLKSKLILSLKNLKYKHYPTNIPKVFIHKNIPYFSQWESPQLAKPIIENSINAIDDPNWEQSGAKTKAEYASWSWNGCGMACLKMVLAYKTSKEIPLVVLGKKCVEYGGYTLPIEQSIGLLYKPFTKFVQQEYGLKTKIVSSMTIHELVLEIANRNVIIASVSPQIRHATSKPKQKGGHLVVVLGYDLDKKLLYFHNPSGFTKATQQFASVTFAEFSKFFANRGMVILI